MQLHTAAETFTEPFSSKQPSPFRESRTPIDAISRSERRLALLSGFALFVYVFLANSWVGDDAYITFRVVDNFINGYGLRWNVIERVQTYTNPLWMLLMSAAYLFTREVYFTSIALSFALCTLALGVIVRALPQLRRAALLLALVLSSKAFVDYTSSGLENPLTYAIDAMFLVLYLRTVEESTRDNGAPPARRVGAMACLVALAFVDRIDAVLLLLPAMAHVAWLAWRARGLRGLLPIVYGSLPAVAWLLFAVIYYGFPFPNTYYAKASAGFLRSIQIEQGLAYLANSLRFDPATLTIIAIATLWGLGERGPARYVASGLLLTVVYVVWVGGDFMSGRFLSAACLAAAFLIARAVVRLPILVGALAVAVGYNAIWQNAPIKMTPSREPAWAWQTQNAIKDEHGNFHPLTNLLAYAPLQRRPQHPLALEGQTLRASGERVAVKPWIGMVGFYAGPEKYLIDPNGLGDALMARLPIDDDIYLYFYASHFGRSLPDGYFESRLHGTNAIADPLIHSYYDRLLRVTTGPIWSLARFHDIVAFNVGGLRDVQRQIVAHRPVRISATAVHERLDTELSVPDGNEGVRSTGEAGFMQRGPSTPLSAGRYRVVWYGAVRTNPAPGQPLGRVVACYNECRTVIASAPVHPPAEEGGSQAPAVMELPIRLPTDVVDLEYRLYVNRGVILRLERVTLTSDGDNNAQ
jgi:arabinofuranosyltransferase